MNAKGLPSDKEGIDMSIDQESPAVAIARAHVDAWSNHDFDTARSSLAADVKVTATTTNPACRGKVTLPAARLYLLDEADEIKVEQLVFLVPD
jgi:hypothetical protein